MTFHPSGAVTLTGRGATTLPRRVRGRAPTNSRRRGAAIGRELLLDRGPQVVERRWGGRIGGHDHGHHRLAPLRIGAPHHRHLGHPRGPGQDPLDRGRPHVLAARDDQVVQPTVHAQVAGLVDAPVVSGGEPAVGVAGIGAVAVGPQQHVTPDLDLAVGAGADLDAVEGPAVVDAGAARLGQAVAGHGVGRQLGRRRRPAHHQAPEPRRVDAGQRGGDDRHQGGAPSGRVVDRGGIEAGVELERGGGEQGPGHHRQTPDVGQRAGNPAIGRGPDRRRGGRCWPGPRRPPRRGCGPPPWVVPWSHWWPPPGRRPPRPPGRRGSGGVRRRDRPARRAAATRSGRPGPGPAGGDRPGAGRRRRPRCAAARRRRPVLPGP